jgi:hypothetical protein
MRIRRKPDFLLRTIFQEQRRPLHRTFHICFWGDNHHSFHLFQEWATTTWHVAHSQTNGVFPGCCVRISLQEPVFTGGPSSPTEHCKTGLSIRAQYAPGDCASSSLFLPTRNRASHASPEFLPQERTTHRCGQNPLP